MQGEIAFAEANGIPLFIVWAGGLHWSRTVPLHMTEAPYVDARHRYENALETLSDQITKLMGNTSMLRITDTSGEFETHVPENHIVVDYPNGHTVPLDIGMLGTVNEVVSKVYFKGASHQVSPDSYGEEWVLGQKVFRPEWESSFPVMRVAMGLSAFRHLLEISLHQDPLRVIKQRVEVDDVRGLQGLRVNKDRMRFTRQEASYMGAVTGTRWQVLMRKGDALVCGCGRASRCVVPRYDSAGTKY